MKDSYYFPHDANAIHDPKCAALVNDFGMTGYGMYWSLIEVMHEQKDGKLEKFPKLYEGLAHEFKCDKEALVKLIEAMLRDYFLLKEDEKFIWSDRVLRNLEQRKEKYLKKMEAGRIGGLRSGEARRSKQNEAVLEANEQKERKGKERKLYKNMYRGFVKPTIEEIQKYCQERKNSVFAERFFNFYESKGWVVGKTKMRDWKAAVRNWEGINKEVDNTPRQNPKKDCPECHGSGAIYAPGSGKQAKCRCTIKKC